MKRRLLPVIALVLAVVACGGATQTSTTIPADQPERPLLSVTDEGGFVPIDFMINRPPRYVLTSKGRLFYQGAVMAIYPGPLVPNVQVATVGEETLGQVMQYINDVGLPQINGSTIDNDATQFIADASNTVFTYTDEAGVAHSHSVYALGMEAPNGEKKLVNVQLTSMLTLLDEAAATAQGTAFTPESIQIYAGVSEFPVDVQVANVKPWPLDVAFADMTEVIRGWKCIQVDGAEAVSLLTTFTESNEATTWDEGGTEIKLLPRGLLPGETGCAAPAGMGA